MDKEILIELIRIAPSVMLYILGFIAFLLLRRVIIKQLFPKMTGLKIFGIEAKMISQKIDQAYKHWDMDVDPNKKQHVVQRLNRFGKLDQKIKALWIDDDPGNNNYEISILGEIGIELDLAKNSAVAMDLLQSKAYDFIISDIYRGTNPNEGTEFHARIVDHGFKTPIIFYIGNVNHAEGTPPYAFAITDQPVELIHFVLDILERKR